MTANPETPPGNDDAETNARAPNLWLAENYPQYLGIRGLPSDYLKFTVDSPALIDDLIEDFWQMSELRAAACYQDVVDRIIDYMGDPPEFEALVFAPHHESYEAQLKSNLTSFIIGHNLDERMLNPDSHTPIMEETQLIIDAGIAGIFESPTGTTDEQLQYLNPDLLEYDYLTLCQAMDGVIYSETATGGFTVEHLVAHFVSDLTIRQDLILDDPSFYEGIYSPTIEYLLNEHHNAHY